MTKYRTLQIQGRTAELNMTKLVDNGEILTLDNESMSNEPLPKKPICSKSTEEQMIEFREKNDEKHLRYKSYSAKTNDKDNPSFHQSVSVKLI